MPRRAGFIKQPEIMLDTRLSVPLYKQLYERLRGAILAGQLERGARLPSTRTLASELGVSRTTTVLAYELLLLEGYLESRAGNRGGTRCARDAFKLPDKEDTVFTHRCSEDRDHPPGFTCSLAQGHAAAAAQRRTGERGLFRR